MRKTSSQHASLDFRWIPATSTGHGKLCAALARWLAAGAGLLELRGRFELPMNDDSGVFGFVFIPVSVDVEF